jgi:hypothetical protein
LSLEVSRRYAQDKVQKSINPDANSPAATHGEEHFRAWDCLRSHVQLVNSAFGRIFIHAEFLLNNSIQFVDGPLCLLEVVIRQLTPNSLRLPFNLFPLTHRYIPVH